MPKGVSSLKVIENEADTVVLSVGMSPIETGSTVLTVTYGHEVVSVADAL